ncbi:MAG: hypothetical protein HWE25_08580 [Alphaproteobacteria bacterium]|nr:hypothetical protein [Alphaproteobacteria bacterium]
MTLDQTVAKAPSFQAENRALQTLSHACEDDFLRPYAPIASLWSSFPGKMPIRQSIGFRALKGWHDRLIISDLAPDGNISFRLVGNEAGHIFGGLVQPGGRFADLPNTLFNQFPRYFSAIATGGCYGACTGVVPFQSREFLPIRVLDLPALDQKGNIAFLFSFFLSGKDA